MHGQWFESGVSIVSNYLNSYFFITTTRAILSLISLANEYGTPFLKTAVDRLHGNIFENTTARASRTTDVIIFNKSSKTFKLNSNHCEHGCYSSDLFPEYEIPSKKETEDFGVECHGMASGVKGTTRYQDENDGTSFFITSDNPFGGKIRQQNQVVWIWKLHQL